MRRLQVDEFLGQSARLHGDKVALVCGSRRITYRELEDMANQLACGLQAIGVRRGDRVVVFLENSVEAVVSIFGILRAGAAFVPVGPTVKGDKLSYILNDSGATALIAGSSLTWTRWRSAAMTGSLSAESSRARYPALPRATMAAAAWGSEYLEAK